MPGAAKAPLSPPGRFAGAPAAPAAIAATFLPCWGRTPARQERPTCSSPPCRRAPQDGRATDRLAADDRLAAGHRGQDGDLVPVLDRGVESVQEADVLAAHVHVHEPAQVAVLRDPIAEPVEALVEPVEDVAHGRGVVDARLRLAAGDVP